MQSANTAAGADARVRSPRLWAVCEIALVFLVFFIQGAWLAPDVNEPHYLSKARHYWDANWCASDFFFNTADAHQVFYWTFGWLSRWLSLPAMAWCGRLLTWGLLAWAWRRLSWSLVPARLYAVLSAALLITLIDQFQMAGEWLVGGVEAKGFAYVLVLLGLEAIVRGRWTAAWLLLGAASSFHVIIGGWSVVAAGVVWLSSPDRPSLARTIGPLAGGLLLALPGLLPAVALTRGVDPQVVAEANRIYVYERLYHHLLATRFPPLFIARHLVLVAALVALVRLVGPWDRSMWRLQVFVAATVALSAVGMVLSLLAPLVPDFAAGALRFYWFRLSDVFVPAGVALGACAMLWRWQQAGIRWFAPALALAMLAAGAQLGETVWMRRTYAWPPADTAIARLAEFPGPWSESGVAGAMAWREVCTWAAAETPPDAVFLTPRLAQTFRWYAGRAEVVSRKDIPQDAAGIVEWWRRLRTIYETDDGSGGRRWRTSLAEMDAASLQALGRQFGADYVITLAAPPLPLTRVGPRNSSFAVYRLSDAPPRETQSETAPAVSK